MKNFAPLLALLAVIAVVLASKASTQPTPPAAPTTATTHLTCTEPTTTTTTEAPTTTTTTTAPQVEYALTDSERDVIERVVMAEAGGEPFEGQMAVAQCILNACRATDTRPDQVVVDFRYTGNRPDPTDEVKAAVAAVFDDGQTVFSSEVLYFYAPARCTSAWHESQAYVCTIGGHRFFEEVGADG